jgi:sporulation protein YlmC with PRC-barrel domain
MLQRRMFRSFGSLTPGRCFLSPPGTAICFEACFSEREMRRAEKEDAMATSMTGSSENRETHDLIGSDKVEGTNVYRSNGEKVGQIERVMLDKRSGKVGFLGLGHDHYPVPWARLTYNERLGGYEVNISDQELKGAPKYSETEWSWDREQGRKVYDYYKVPPYWS